MKIALIFALLHISVFLSAQDVATLLKEAENFERSLKEVEALDKYKQVLSADPANLAALLKATQLSSLIGGRQQDKKVRVVYLESARTYADKALAIDASNADANYVMALVADKLAEVDTENKKIVEDVKNIKMYAEKALAINPNHARANYMLGKWHFDMVQLSWVKKVAAKTLFGGMPNGKIEDAIAYMEKCKSLEQYYVLNYLELARAYKFDNKPAKAIEVLSKLVHLPNRTADDAALKAEGKKILSEMQ